MSKKPENASKGKTKVKIAIISVIIVIAIAGLAILFQQVILPRVVLARYIGKFDYQITQTAKFTMFYSSNPKSNEVKYDFQAAGIVNLLKPGQETAKANVSGTVTDDKPEEVDSEIRFANNNNMTVLFNHKKPKSLLDRIVPGATLNRWTQINLTEIEKSENGNTCVSDNVGKIYSSSLKELKSIRPDNIRRVGFFSEDISGNRTGHYQGEFDAKTVEKVARSINEQAHKTCPDFFPKDVADSQFSELLGSELKYDLWNGRDFDLIEMHFVKSNKEIVKFSLATEDYNQPVQTANSEEEPLGEIDETYLLTSKDQARTSDEDLKSAVDTIRKVIELEYKQNKTYVASLDLIKKDLAKDFVIPKEVKYAPAPEGCLQDCKSYELFADLSDGTKFERNNPSN